MQKTQHVTGRSLRGRAVSLLLAAALTLGLLPGVPGLVGTARAHWADDYLSQLVEWGVIRSDQTGNPDQALTRADFMAITNRAYGYHEPGPTPFTDVEEDDWFYDDVGIAYNAKYILGTSPTTASPNDTLTRETAATVLGRNMMLQESPGELLDFTDARDISSWARGTIKSSLEHYLVSGYDDGTFGPEDPINREQIAALLWNQQGGQQAEQPGVRHGADHRAEGVAEKMGQNQPVNLPGVPHRMEVGPPVFLQIDGANLHLPPGDAPLLQGQQHVGLILIPVPGHGGELLQIPAGVQKLPRDPAQAGLGVGEGHAAEHPKHPPGDPVARSGAGRHLGPGKVPAAQNHPLLRQHLLGAGQGVLRVVLAVAVYRHHAGAVGPVLQQPGEGGLHGRPLAPVHAVAQKGALGDGLHLLKDRLKGRSAAVIHH